MTVVDKVYDGGTNKTVTLIHIGASVTKGADKYAVSYPAATGTITPKEVMVTVALSDEDLLTDGTTKYFFYDSTPKTPAVTVTTSDGVTLTERAYTVTYSNNKNVGTNATVTVTAKAGGNYAVTASTSRGPLTNTGSAQELVNAGLSNFRTILYSLSKMASILAAIPTGINVGTYNVCYKVEETVNYVPTGSWASDAVDFSSAHEMFNGTSETTFSPNQSITREQFAVMLSRYAGSPAADSQELSFTDADKASGYAMEALRWAAANSILNGYGDGRLDPGGLATRAQAAQMLKNFMENT